MESAENKALHWEARCKRLPWEGRRDCGSDKEIKDTLCTSSGQAPNHVPLGGGGGDAGDDADSDCKSGHDRSLHLLDEVTTEDFHWTSWRSVSWLETLYPAILIHLLWLPIFPLVLELCYPWPFGEDQARSEDTPKQLSSSNWDTLGARKPIR